LQLVEAEYAVLSFELTAEIVHWTNRKRSRGKAGNNFSEFEPAPAHNNDGIRPL
jgi:hypothetical protein